MVKKLFIITFIFLFIISFVLGAHPEVAVNDEYQKLGGSNSQYLRDTYRFNSETEETYFGRAVDNPKYNPLVYDLDENGVNEIIVVDGDTLRIYNFSQSALNVVDAVVIKNTGSPPLIYDIDGDSDEEIIIVETGTDANLRIWSFLGGDLINETEVPLTGSFGSGTGFNVNTIACKDTDECIAVYQTDASAGKITLASFDSTDFYESSAFTIENVANTAGDLACLSHTKNIQVVDYDGDDDLEFVFSWFAKPNSGSSTANVGFVNLNGTNIIEEMPEIERGFVSSPFSTGTTCDDTDVGASITDPMVFDFDDGENGLEILFAMNEDENEFRMHEYRSDGVHEDSFPSLSQANGIIISNLVRADAFDNSPENFDVCVVGYEEDKTQIDLLCASKRRSFGGESEEFILNDINVEDVAYNKEDYHVITHAIQAVNTLTDGRNLNEFSTPFGTLAIGDARLIFTSSADLIWTPQSSPMTVIPVDVDKNERGEYLGYGIGNLWYIKDGFVNTNCDNYNCIRQITSDPSLEVVMDKDTTFHISMTIQDFDTINGLAEDGIAGRVVIYEGDVNEQDSGWSINYSSQPVTISYTTFDLNKEGTFQASFYARDTNNPLLEQVITLPMTVDADGVKFGEAPIFEYNAVDPEAPGDEIDEVGVSTANPAYMVVKGLADNTGFTQSMIWRFFMLLVPIMGAVILFQTRDFSSQHIFAVIMLIGIIEVMMVIYGASVGYLGFGYVLTIAITAIAGLGFYIRNLLMGHNRGLN